MTDLPETRLPDSVFPFSIRDIALTARPCIYCAVAGAIACWLPPFVVDWFTRNERLQVLWWVVFPTIAQPLFTTVAIRFLRRYVSASPALIPLSVFVGIWVLGPLLMTIGMVPLGGGFGSPAEFHWSELLFLIFPPVTFVMSAYVGCTFGLLLTTAITIIWSVRLRRVRAE